MIITTDFNHTKDIEALYEHIKFLQNKLNELTILNDTYIKMIKDLNKVIDLLDGKDK